MPDELKDSLTGELLPEPGNEWLGYKVFQILGEGMEHKASLGLPKKWTNNYELGRNKHWKQKSISMTCKMK